MEENIYELEERAPAGEPTYETCLSAENLAVQRNYIPPAHGEVSLRKIPSRLRNIGICSGFGLVIVLQCMFFAAGVYWVTNGAIEEVKMLNNIKLDKLVDKLDLIYGLFFCNLSRDGEWFVIQRRQVFDIAFNKSYEEYVNGFGNPIEGDFWAGLEAMHKMTNNGSKWVMRTEFEVWKNDKAYWIEYTGFSVGDASSKYKLTLGSQTGGSFKDSDRYGWRYHDGMMFTAYDEDNDDRSYANCAESFKGGWWYKSCRYVILNNLRATSAGDDYTHMTYYVSSEDKWHRLKNSVIKIKPL